MPQTYSVDLYTEWEAARGVTITERRLGVAEFRDDGWEAAHDEAEVSLGDVTVTLNHKVAQVTFRTLAIFSLRALAERIQWGWQEE